MTFNGYESDILDISSINNSLLDLNSMKFNQISNNIGVEIGNVSISKPEIICIIYNNSFVFPNDLFNLQSHIDNLRCAGARAGCCI